MAFRRLFVIFLFLSLGTFELSASELSSQQDKLQLSSKNRIYILGVVPQFSVRKVQAIWQPILDKLAAESGIAIMLKPANDIPSFEDAFLRGEYDIAYMNPYHAIVAHKEKGYLPILRDLSKQLFGVIVVRNDSPINAVEELDQKNVVFPAPNALGAALIPRAEFASKFKITPNYRYVKSHDSVYLNVVLGTADAGGGVMGTFKKQEKEVRDQLRVLHKTAKVPRHPIVIHPRVAIADRERIASAFLSMSENVAGSELLKKVPIGRIGKAQIEDYKVLTEMGLDAFYIRSKHQ